MTLKFPQYRPSKSLANLYIYRGVFHLHRDKGKMTRLCTILPYKKLTSWWMGYKDFINKMNVETILCFPFKNRSIKLLRQIAYLILIENDSEWNQQAKIELLQCILIKKECFIKRTCGIYIADTS